MTKNAIFQIEMFCKLSLILFIGTPFTKMIGFIIERGVLHLDLDRIKFALVCLLIIRLSIPILKR